MTVGDKKEKKITSPSAISLQTKDRPASMRPRHAGVVRPQSDKIFAPENAGGSELADIHELFVYLFKT
jgi:hypothetical protein